MFYSNLIYLLVILFLLYKILLKKDYDLLSALVFVLPFHSWYYNIGLNLTMYQIIMLLIIVVIFMKTIIGKNMKFIGNTYINIFILYITSITMFISVFILDDYLSLGGFFRSEGRFLSQIILYLISFSLLYIIFNYIKNTMDIIKYLKIYLTSLVVLVFLGWSQFSIYNVSGLDIFPLAVLDSGYVKSGLFSSDSLNIFRMSSLGGEPKGFSMSLTVGFFIVHIFNNNKIFFFKYDKLIKYLFLVTLLATLSTSGIVMFIILFISYYLYSFTNNVRISFSFKKLISLVFLLIVITSLYLNYKSTINILIETRIMSRDIASEDFDAPIKIMLTEKPQNAIFGSGLGNIHNISYQYIPEQYRFYMLNSIYSAKSGYLKLISEIGIIGLLIFLLIFYVTFKNLSSQFYTEHNFSNSIKVLLILTLLGYLARVYLFNELIVVLSISLAYIYNNKGKVIEN